MAYFLTPMLENTSHQWWLGLQDDKAAHVKPSTQKLSLLIWLSLIMELLEKTRKDRERRGAVIVRGFWVSIV